MNCTWIVYAVCNGHGLKFLTKGLARDFETLELELNLNVSLENGGLVLNVIAEQISEGKRYTDFERVTGLFTMPFYVIETVPCSLPQDERENPDYEKVLRVVIPDYQGRFPWEDGCEEGFKDQLIPEEIERVCMLSLNGR